MEFAKGISQVDYMKQNKAVQEWSSAVRGKLKAASARFVKGKTGTIIRPSKGKKREHYVSSQVIFLKQNTGGGMVSRPFKFKADLEEAETRTREEQKLKQSISHRVFYKFGISEGVGFRLERHGIFVHYGVGRGYKRMGGMVIRQSKNPGGTPRQPQNWFNPVIDANVPALANRVAEINADAVINAARLQLK